MQKEIVLQKAQTLFTQFGCKRVSMDDVANSLGISKKTIYVHFKNKRELVEQSVDYLLNRVRAEIDLYYNSKAFANKPFKRIEEIYRVGLKELRNLSPTFLYGLQKYYPEAYALFNNFRSEVVWTYVWELLMEAREKGQIRESINLKLVCEIFLLRIDNIILPFSEFFENYSIDELLEHLVVVPLQGIRKKNNNDFNTTKPKGK